MAVQTFSVADYVVLFLSFAIALIIGFFHAYRSRKNQTTDEYLLGSRTMPLIPVALSIMATIYTANSMLGIPAENYLYGMQYFFNSISSAIASLITAYLFLPVLFNIKSATINEYLKRRFGNSIKLLGSCSYILQTMLHMSVALYSPSLALNAVTGFSITLGILLVGLVATFYTAIGGMKAVVWTDAFQVLIMFSSLLGLAIQIFILLDDGEIWKRIIDGGQFVVSFNPDPTERYTLWIVLVGSIPMWMGFTTVNQNIAQRYFSMASLLQAQKSILISIILATFFKILIHLCGLLLYAYYYYCDPLKIGAIQKADQIMPYAVMNILGKFSGIPGLFVAGTFSASLSTLSSGINCVAAVLLQDIIKPQIKRTFSDVQATRLLKIMSVFIGLIIIALAYGAQHIGGIVQIVMTINGLISGPLLGVFTLGLFFPYANTKSALIGSLTGFTLMLWIGIGSLIYKPYVPRLPTYTTECSLNDTNFIQYLNVSSSLGNITNAILSDDGTRVSGLLKFYRLSMFWYTSASSLTTILVGLLISHFMDFKPEAIDPNLVFPVFYKIGCFLPDHIRMKLLMGVKYKGEYGVYSDPNEREDVLVEKSLLNVILDTQNNTSGKQKEENTELEV